MWQSNNNRFLPLDGASDNYEVDDVTHLPNSRVLGGDLWPPTAFIVFVCYDPDICEVMDLVFETHPVHPLVFLFFGGGVCP